ncbi:MAG: type II toxin-antitoxin system RelE/ParE family toxin [Phycisphaerae bacterium]|nr:type II toxin-antitoxin system RelE/ParE family toxin [Phycisphaerae bacterium]
MAQIRWTAQAADDLEAITEFISADSPYYAQLFAIDVLAAIERLTDFPQSGRKVPEINDPAIRELILGDYRIVYRLRSALVEILTVFHGARILNPSDLK